MISIDINIIRKWIMINNRLNVSKGKSIRTVEELELLLFKVHHPLNILYKIIEDKYDLKNS